MQGLCHKSVLDFAAKFKENVFFLMKKGKVPVQVAIWSYEKQGRELVATIVEELEPSMR